ncbi:NAD-specific glutamate dehydrogenase-domain-containing protein [Hygrophoropsis aurantiaca]|uniref:NAD-specific glutamate dehydrogenase-domain-containing protein n=1 Tax=Hygrophoropsis aurantiaca TaxID=72124 RepID=A0ACB8A6K3_9AGAM|nr:NAD-specific glutamate dehydrogenase-domain-containing protein [Hygrophoropsis aurantiaca]
MLRDMPVGRVRARRRLADGELVKQDVEIWNSADSGWTRRRSRGQRRSCLRPCLAELDRGGIRQKPLSIVASKDALDGTGHTGHTGHTTDQDDAIDLASFDTRIAEHLLARADYALDERADKGLELGAHELHVDVLGTRRVSGNEWQVISVCVVGDNSNSAFSAASRIRWMAMRFLLHQISEA